jgi:DNA-binding transcriptional LysR family regulator
MDLLMLNTFSTVARLGSVSAAALEMHTVQSNVTARIKQLEADVGASLFERHSRGVTITTAGERLLVYADRVRALLVDAQAAVQDDGSVRGTLRIGSMETTAAVRLPGLLNTYHKAHPAVQLEVRTGTTAELIEQLLARQHDIALVAGPIDHPDLIAEPAFHEELVLVLGRDAPGIREQLSSGALTVVVFRQGCSYRHRLETYFAAQGWPGFRRLEFGTLEGMLGCVAAGVGVTVIPRSVVERCGYKDELRIESLFPGPLMVETLLLRRADAYPSAPVRQFLASFPGAIDADGDAADARATMPLRAIASAR